MMNIYIVFGAVVLLFDFLLIYINRRRHLGVSTYLLVIAFNFKVLLGCLYGKFYVSQIPTADTWNFFFNGNQINQEHWHSFIKTDPRKNFNLLSSSSYFNYYRYVVLDLFSAICSLVTGGRYYCNVIIFNFITFFGILRLYRFLANQNPPFKPIFYLILFFFPPFVFWTSGFHRDGICMAFLGCLLLRLQLYLKNYQSKNLIFSILYLFIILFMRSFWGFSSMIICILWFVSTKLQSKNAFKTFSIGMIGVLALFILSAFAPDSANFALSLVKKQHAFLRLTGNSELPIVPLSVNIWAYLHALFEGFNHLLLRPYLNEVWHSSLYLLAYLDNLLVCLLFVLALFFMLKRKSEKVMIQPENNVLLFLVLINYAVIGITVPFLGAIVRYKAPFEVLLIILLIQFIPYKYFSKIVPRRFRNHLY